MRRMKGIILTALIIFPAAALLAQDSASLNVKDFTAFVKGKKIEFEWTAPGGDGTAGRNLSYELRYSVNPVPEENAERIPKVRPSRKKGKILSFCGRGLDASGKLYFILKITDKNGRTGVSNATPSGPDPDKAEIYMNRANDIFYAEKKDYKTAVEYFVKSMDSGARVKDVDLLFKIAFCYNKLGDRRSSKYFDLHLANQQYYYLIKSPHMKEDLDINKYGDFLAGISFLGPAFTEPKKKEETVMYVPDNWVQKFRAQGTYLFLFYIVDYAYCYGDFPDCFLDVLFAELDEVVTGKSRVSNAYVYSAVAAHYLFNKRYDKALKYYKLAADRPGNEEEYAKNLKGMLEKVSKLAGIKGGVPSATSGE